MFFKLYSVDWYTVPRWKMLTHQDGNLLLGYTYGRITTSENQPIETRCSIYEDMISSLFVTGAPDDVICMAVRDYIDIVIRNACSVPLERMHIHLIQVCQLCILFDLKIKDLNPVLKKVIQIWNPSDDIQNGQKNILRFYFHILSEKTFPDDLRSLFIDRYNYMDFFSALAKEDILQVSEIIDGHFLHVLSLVNNEKLAERKLFLSRTVHFRRIGQGFFNSSARKIVEILGYKLPPKNQSTDLFYL